MPVPIDFDLNSKRTTTGIQKSKNKKGQKEQISQQLLKSLKDEERLKIQKAKKSTLKEEKVDGSVLDRFVKIKSKKKNN